MTGGAGAGTRGGAGRPRVLHLHSSFAPGGKELRCVQLINAFGPGVAHSVVSAEPEELGAARFVAKGIAIACPRDFPALTGLPLPGRLARIARAMQGYDLVLTYNWGAMDAVLARTLFADLMKLPPLIHHEDGFDTDERVRLKRRRNWYRQIALGKAAGLVVPSETLERIALECWQQPPGRVRRIPNGIDTDAFAARPRPDALRGVIKPGGELWVGAIAGLRPVKRLDRLVRVFANLPGRWHLVIVGDGPERAVVLAEAERLGIGHRVHLPGFVPDPHRYVGLFDIFALSSDSEQFPISVVEAMAAGVPVCAPAVGDIARMVAPGNAEYIAPVEGEGEGEGALAAALAALAGSRAARDKVGEANRRHARAHYDAKAMIAAYRRLYAGAGGRDL